MNWRTNTLAEKPGHRHEQGELKEAPPGAWKPSDGYVQPRFHWAVIVAYVFAGICLAAAIGAAIKGALA
jgi:hypothetical protein